MKADRPLRLVVLACAAVACGALLFVLLRAETGRPDGSPSVHAPDSAAAAAVTPTSTPVPAPVGTATNPAADDGRSAVSLDRAATEPGRRATGRLIDAAGRPLAQRDVELQIDDALAPRDPRLRILGPIPPRFRGHATVTSHDDGTFLLPLPKGVRARIAPALADFVFRQGAIEIDAAPDDLELGDIVVLRASVLAGIVRDPQGTPCRDVRVLCGRDDPSFDEPNAQQRTTDEDGAFRFSGLRRGALRILCRAPHFVDASRRVELQDEELRTDLEFVFASGAAIAGSVVGDDEAPIPGAEVRAKPLAGGATIRVLCEADGRFTVDGLTDGDYDLTARATGFRGDRQKPVRAHSGARDVTVRIARAASIAGVVIDAGGEAVAGSKLYAVPSSQPRAQDPQARLFQSGATTGVDGRFTLPDLGGGDYRILAYGPHLDARLDEVHAEAGRPITDLRIVVDRGGVVEFRVRDPDGAPVAGAKLRVSNATAPPQRPMVLIGGGNDVDPDELGLDARLARGVTDERGSAVISGLLAGSYRADVESESFVQDRPARFSTDGATRAAIDVTLSHGGRVRFEVVDGSGATLPHKRVEIEGPLDLEPAPTRGGDSDVAGRLELGPLAAGRYAAAIGKTVDTDAFGGATLVTQGAGPTFAASRVEFEVQADAASTVRLTCPSLLTLHGTLHDPRGTIPDGSVRIGRTDSDRQAANARFGLDGSTRSARTQVDGSFRITDLEAGTCRVRFGRRDQAMPAEITLDLNPETAAVPLDLVLRAGSIHIAARSAVDHHTLAGAHAILRPAGTADAGAERGILDYAFPTERSSSTSADTDGIARFAVVPFGTYVVELQAGGHRNSTSAVVSVDREGVDAGVVELPQGGRVTGAFLDPDAGAAALACVEYRSANATEFQTTFGSRGTFVVDGLDAGDYVLRARRMGNLAGLGTPGPEQRIHVEIGATATVDLQLAPQ